MKIYPSNMNHLRFTKPTNQEIQQKYNFPCSITVLNQDNNIAEMYYYDSEGNKFPIINTSNITQIGDVTYISDVQFTSQSITMTNVPSRKGNLSKCSIYRDGEILKIVI